MVTTHSFLGGFPPPEAFAGSLGAAPPPPPIGQLGVGVVVPYDFALDRELWRWAPENVTLHLTRTPYAALPVTVEQAVLVGETSVVTQCATDLLTVQPDVVAYACTSGSFVAGRAGELALVNAILEAGVPSAVTTSGALLEALTHVGARRIAIATPYDQPITALLEAFLGEAGVEVVRAGFLGLTGRIWTVPYATTANLIREASDVDCEAVFVSCTNLPTYDLIAPLEEELGVPVLTANQVTLWAALRRAGVDATGPGQRLLADHAEGSAR
jgi:maleate isomerase